MELIYKGLRGTLEHMEVSDSEVERQLKRLQEQTPRRVPVTDRPAQNGDEVVLDYAGYCDGVQFEGGTAEKQSLTLGSGMFIPGFEEQLTGAKIGEDVTVHVTFPKDYRAENLAGRDAEFRCKIHEIRQNVPYELDDTFAKEVGQCRTLDEMRGRLRESLRAYYEDCAEMELQDKLMRQVAATLDYKPTDAELEQGLTQLNRLKTCAMISAAAELGCVAAGLDGEKRRQAREFGDGLGLAFQIRDDILDVTGSEDVFGKPIGSDAEEGKTTFVNLKGLEECQREVERQTARAKAAISGWPGCEFLMELADRMVSRVK